MLHCFTNVFINFRWVFNLIIPNFKIRSYYNLICHIWWCLRQQTCPSTPKELYLSLIHISYTRVHIVGFSGFEEVGFAFPALLNPYSDFPLHCPLPVSYTHLFHLVLITWFTMGSGTEIMSAGSSRIIRFMMQNAVESVLEKKHQMCIRDSNAADGNSGKSFGEMWMRRHTRLRWLCFLKEGYLIRIK